MLWPLMACLLLPWLLVYLGLHIVRREVIFVDLALAQVAALGTCTAILLKYEPHDWQSYGFSIGFTVVGAAIFSLTRSSHHQRVPQEALIGIVYVVAAAGGILLLSNSAHGAEELRETLVGELLYLQKPAQVLKPFALYLAIGAIHFVFRKKFLAISFDPEKAEAEKISMRGWDFLFYALFGLAVTTFVPIGGVLLVFSFLIVPAVCANFLAEKLNSMLIIGCLIAIVCSVGGLYASYKISLPAGATIVCALGAALLVTAAVARLKKTNHAPPESSP